MRWQLIAVAVCMASSNAAACPLEPSLIVGGEELELAHSEQLPTRRVPSQPIVYLDTRSLYWPRLDNRSADSLAGFPVFRRADGSTIPFVIRPTPINGILALTLALDHGAVVVELEYRGEYHDVAHLVVGPSATRTRRATRETSGLYDHWRIDSDAALFRIETPGHVEYAVSTSSLYVDTDALVTAIHPDGREEVIGGGDYHLNELPLEIPWWAFGLVLTGLGSAWLSRRAITA